MNFLGWLNKIKNFFGLFNLNEFEIALIQKLRESVDELTVLAIEDQLSRFNRVQRILSDDERLICGSTMFYWIKYGHSLINKFPIRIKPIETTEEFLFFRCTVIDSINNEIRVDFYAVYGVFVLMEYYSEKRIWYPHGEYRFNTIENLLAPSAGEQRDRSR